MQSREPSMEDILASIKRVIAEEKELRAAVPPPLPGEESEEEDVLELDESMAAEEALPPMELGPPLLDEEAADTSRQKLEALSTVAAVCSVKLRTASSNSGPGVTCITSFTSHFGGPSPA